MISKCVGIVRSWLPLSMHGDPNLWESLRFGGKPCPQHSSKHGRIGTIIHPLSKPNLITDGTDKLDLFWIKVFKPMPYWVCIEYTPIYGHIWPYMAGPYLGYPYATHNFSIFYWKNTVPVCHIHLAYMAIYGHTWLKYCWLGHPRKPSDLFGNLAGCRLGVI